MSRAGQHDAPGNANGAKGAETGTVPALLVLEDGRAFRGRSFGAHGETLGEIVFQTGMTGYQETLTDPSYHRQIVAMTAPHIGNTGVNDDDPESGRVWVAGYVVREPARIPSNWRAKRTLDAELRRQGVVGIAMPGTRSLTRHLRDRGAMRAAISTTETDPVRLRERVLASPPMSGADLANEVTTTEPYTVRPTEGVPERFRVTAVDLGIKAMTPQRLAERGCLVRVVPADATVEDVLADDPDGVFFSNGPGDPATTDGPVAVMRAVLDAGVPLFGICFGNQILGRALGLGTYKLRFGHRGVNQPVRDVHTGRVYITSHNHGFAVDAPLDGAFDTPYGRAEVSHIGLNDQVVEGLRLLDRPAFSVQYHPEAAAGPHDAAAHFDAFCDLMSNHAGDAATTTPTAPTGGA
ncbi:glutamine-hydrolyzing carbamoyl-phosphate synthase small subunit [Spiractinospora alimapuensis]|uniref:glutamine-hydrolyzing carbamoyl-phosphate synthase small subunit n=1 Tax=Spiractinospora alimapuensis TaxID=2820884 RepID=UPI001EEB1342|nr:glutamine-hydrolyzing carbamoyl-phosphate synthase small subunit [Spiractinospora alimapuensis]QVQ53203.1 glutamine-hydrolyzing carbamoyl-phosphate synthase small subunit [Spiractinospora alimapuensis]